MKACYDRQLTDQSRSFPPPLEVDENITLLALDLLLHILHCVPAKSHRTFTLGIQYAGMMSSRT